MKRRARLVHENVYAGRTKSMLRRHRLNAEFWSIVKGDYHTAIQRNNTSHRKG